MNHSEHVFYAIYNFTSPYNGYASLANTAEILIDWILKLAGVAQWKYVGFDRRPFPGLRLTCSWWVTI